MESRNRMFLGAFLLALTAMALAPLLAAHAAPQSLEPLPDTSGEFQTLSTQGRIDHQNPFFLAEGSNGRTCASCHSPRTGWSLSPWEVQERFLRSQGLDPLFRPVDGSTCPSDDVSSLWARLRSYRLLLSKGLIRISMPVPADADFEITGVATPYACTDTGNPSFYRRPLPATNLRFVPAIMWDGREPTLSSQALDAILGHAQGVTPPSAAVLDQIVAFESSLASAQLVDRGAGALTEGGAQGGPLAVLQQPFTVGENAIAADGEVPNPDVMDLYTAWTHSRVPQRNAIARGEAIFNRRPILITGVAGLNDALGLPVITGTCSTCHNAANVGDHSSVGFLNIGTADAAQRTPDLPLYSVACADGTQVQASDLGRAMISGRCADIGKFKGPVLRALAARAPYFHNGMAATLLEVVNFYNDRFHLGLSAQEKSDLAAFLASL
ncbi:MAG: hypothetical protein ACRD1C_09810 [Terriglobales bacterium]